jgi:hypothetical protein
VTFAFPFKGTIVGASVSASQTTPAAASLNSITVPATGLIGADRCLICIFAVNSAVFEGLEFPIAAGQNISIDVKVAATFSFFVKL